MDQLKSFNISVIFDQKTNTLKIKNNNTNDFINYIVNDGDDIDFILDTIKIKIKKNLY